MFPFHGLTLLDENGHLLHLWRINAVFITNDLSSNTYRYVQN